MDNPHNLTVELRKSIGIYAAQFGDAVVETTQENPFMEVWVGGRVIEMGYGHKFVRAGLCAKDGKWTNLDSHVNKWGQQAFEFISAEVQRLTGADVPTALFLAKSAVGPEAEDLDEE